MVEPVNLNKARKARMRTQKAQLAAQNRVLHGVPAKARKAAKDQEALLSARLDGARLDGNGTERVTTLSGRGGKTAASDDQGAV